MTTAPPSKSIDYKEQAKLQWTETPCGSLTDGAISPGTAEYFAAVDFDRYVRYAPWFRNKVRFDRFKGADILEIGYGQGTDLFQFAKAGAASLTGIDLSPSHQHLARRRFELAGVRADLRLHDAEQPWPFASGSFDVVYSFGVLHHTPEPQKALREAFRVLRPGGRVIIGLYHRRSIFSAYRFLDWLISGQWRTESFDESFWRIEAHAENTTARTLVNRYTRSDVRRLLADFEGVHTWVDHFGADARLTRWLPASLTQRMAELWGWYVFGEGKKSVARLPEKRPRDSG
jgi:SAM-dependent methyltransferase